jgi:outer membrane protein assembly factor BamB
VWAARGSLALTALACTDPTTGGEGHTFAIAPDTVTGWVGETVLFRVTADVGTEVGSPRDLTWVVADPGIAVFVETGDAGALVLVRGSGTTVVTVRAGALTARADLTGIAEGELLTYHTLGWGALIQSPSLDEFGNLHMLPIWPRDNAGPTPGQTLLSLYPDLTLRWEAPRRPSLAMFAPAVGADGALYFSAGDYTAAYSLDGSQLWEDTTHTSGETAPAIGPGGRVYVAGRPLLGSPETWAIAAYDPAGTRLFRTPAFGDEIKVGLTIVADSVVVGADRGNRAFGLSLSGALLWVDTLPSPVGFFSPSVGADGRTVYFPGAEHVVAVDALTGERRWVWQAEGRWPLTPVVDGVGVLYVQTQAAVTALNPDGTVKWSADSLGGRHYYSVGGAPALTDAGVLYVGCRIDLCAVRTADGSVRWRRPLPFPGPPGPIMVARDSSIVFVTLGLLPYGGGLTDSTRVVRLRGRFPLADAPWPVEGGNLRRTRRAPPAMAAGR